MSNIPPPPPPNIPPPPPPGFGGPPPPPGGDSPYGATGGPVYASAGGTSVPAGIGQRFGAMLLDGLLFALVLIPGFVMLVAGPSEITTCSVDSDGNIDFDGDFTGLCEGPTGGTIAIAVVLFAVCGLGFLLFQATREGKTGQTIGKGAVGIKTIDANTGQYIGTGRAFGRALFARIISNNLCFLGYLWAFWDPRKQTWHDKVVNSVVIKG